MGVWPLRSPAESSADQDLASGYAFLGRASSVTSLYPHDSAGRSKRVAATVSLVDDNLRKRRWVTCWGHTALPWGPSPACSPSGAWAEGGRTLKSLQGTFSFPCYPCGALGQWEVFFFFFFFSYQNWQLAYGNWASAESQVLCADNRGARSLVAFFVSVPCYP